MMEYSIVRQFVIAVCLAAGAASAMADVDVKDPWVRGTVPAQKTTGAFMTITSDTDATLIGASSPVADTVEVHTMQMEAGVMKMRAINRLDLPAGRAVELKPGGYHIMLIGLKRALSKGDAVPLKLQIEGKDKSVLEIDVQAQVHALAAGHNKH